MKKLPIAILVILLFRVAPGQTLAEWLQQKKTQIQYLEQQIVALKAYAVVAQKGYAIDKLGLTLIGDIKSGDFSLHADYFSSLNKLSINVKDYTKIADIILLQIGIVKVCHRQRINIQNSGKFSSDEIIYLRKVFNNLLQGCSEIINQMIAITSDGLVQMKDNERIKNIDKLYDSMQARWQFVQDFASGNCRIALQRLRQQNDVDVGRDLYAE